MNVLEQFKFGHWFLISLIVVGIVAGVNELQLSQKEVHRWQQVIATPSPSPYIVSSPSPYPSPEPSFTMEVPDKTFSAHNTHTRSYGIFYPSSESLVINNSRPTIVGKISQANRELLLTKFGKEVSPINGETMNFIRYLPGRVRNASLLIDNKTALPMFGFAAQPTIACFDEKQQEIMTKEECLKQQDFRVPDLIFFAQPAFNLAEGKHTVAVKIGNEALEEMSFEINKNVILPVQAVPKVIPQKPYYDLLGAADNCTRGYHFDRHFLAVPLVIVDNPNLFYGYIFPQSQKERNKVGNKEVFIQFEGKKFPIFFPDKSRVPKDKKEKYYYDIFLPLNNLVFADGQLAQPSGIANSTSVADDDYFEIFPIDAVGRKYEGYHIPFSTTSWSWCDG
jgi:hypothetical protein